MIPFGLAAAATASVLFMLHQSPMPSKSVAANDPPAPTLSEGARLRANAQASHLSLPDGSKIVANSFADLELLALRPDHAVFRLRSGRALFDVAPNPLRLFTVQAGPVQVNVLGTEFSVRRTPSDTNRGERIEVSVLRGVVAVIHGEDQHRLQAGETYALDEPVGGPALPASLRLPEAPANAAPRRQQHRDTPPDLAALRFQAATNARLAKHHEHAAALYETFLKLHPNDPRASLVAFELGCTRMDALGDPNRAIFALQRSLRLGPQSPFRQDALARLVRLHEAQGQKQECAQAQQTYVREYPQGRLIGDVRQRCRDF